MSRDTEPEQVSRPFFGRVRDLAYALERARTQGLTVLIGRPQVGKSRLLRQVYTDLRAQHGFLEVLDGYTVADFLPRAPVLIRLLNHSLEASQ